MKIRDVIDGRYACFDKMGPLNKSAQIEAVCHLQFLMATSGIDANDWDLQEVFGTGDGNKIHQLKNELNRRFFEYSKLNNQGLNPQLEPFAKDIKDKINHTCRYYKDQARRRANDQIRSLKRSIENSHYTLNGYYKSLSENIQTLSDLDSKDLKITDSISKGLKSGFFSIDSYSNETGNLYLVTQPITLTYKNPAQGMDLKVNMGRYRVSLNAQHQSLVVHMYENNLVYQGVIHPYVGSYGNICYGEASKTYQTLMQAYNIGGQLELLESLLKSYSPESSPFYHLSHFVNAKRFNLPEHHKKYKQGECDICGAAIDSSCKCKNNPYHPEAAFYTLPADSRPADSIIDADEIEEEVCADCEENLEHCSCHDSPEEDEPVIRAHD